MDVNPRILPQGSRAPDHIRWISLDQIVEPGAYVCRETGDLIRVPRDGGSSGDQELLGDHSEQPRHVTRIHPDPFIPITKARFAAAELDIEIAF
jgi:hypothetical protein